jgi:hypothetical protein
VYKLNSTQKSKQSPFLASDVFFTSKAKNFLLVNANKMTFTKGCKRCTTMKITVFGRESFAVNDTLYFAGCLI